MKLIYPTPIPDFTGYLIQASHESLTIRSDFEMIQKVRFEYFTDDGTGNFGIPVFQQIDENTNLSPDQKRRLKVFFAPSFREASTVGHKVDPTTLELLEADFNTYPETGYPADAIDEKQVWINVLASDVPGTKVSEKVQNMLLQSIQKMIDNKRI